MSTLTGRVMMTLGRLRPYRLTEVITHCLMGTGRFESESRIRNAALDAVGAWIENINSGVGSHKVLAGTARSVRHCLFSFREPSVHTYGSSGIRN